MREEASGRRYDGSLKRALLIAPPAAALLGLIGYVFRILQAVIVAADEAAARGAEVQMDLTDLLTLGAAQHYLLILALTALGTGLLLAPASLLFLRQRWPVGLLRGMAALLGLLPWAALTVQVLWAGVAGPPLAGVVLIIGGLAYALIPLVATVLFLRRLKPREELTRQDLEMDESASERMPFLASTKGKDERT